MVLWRLVRTCESLPLRMVSSSSPPSSLPCRARSHQRTYKDQQHRPRIGKQGIHQRRHRNKQQGRQSSDITICKQSQLNNIHKQQDSGDPCIRLTVKDFCKQAGCNGYDHNEKILIDSDTPDVKSPQAGSDDIKIVIISCSHKRCSKPSFIICFIQEFIKLITFSRKQLIKLQKQRFIKLQKQQLVKLQKQQLVRLQKQRR